MWSPRPLAGARVCGCPGPYGQGIWSADAPAYVRGSGLQAPRARAGGRRRTALPSRTGEASGRADGARRNYGETRDRLKRKKGGGPGRGPALRLLLGRTSGFGGGKLHPTGQSDCITSREKSKATHPPQKSLGQTGRQGIARPGGTGMHLKVLAFCRGTSIISQSPQRTHAEHVESRERPQHKVPQSFPKPPARRQHGPARPAEISRNSRQSLRQNSGKLPESFRKASESFRKLPERPWKFARRLCGCVFRKRQGNLRETLRRIAVANPARRGDSRASLRHAGHSGTKRRSASPRGNTDKTSKNYCSFRSVAGTRSLHPISTFRIPPIPRNNARLPSRSSAPAPRNPSFPAPRDYPLKTLPRPLPQKARLCTGERR
jgi:hypothetical protein